MRIRILIILVIIALTLLAANYITGRIIAGILDDVIQEQVAIQTPDATMSYDRIGVNPVMARVHLNKLDYTNPESHRFVSDRTSIHLSFFDVLRSMRSDQPLEDINSFVIISRGSDWEDIEESRSLSFSEGEWQFHGNLGKLFGTDGRPVAGERQQRIRFTANRPVLTNFFEGSPVGEILHPLPENTELSRVTGVMEYQPEEGISYLRPLNIEAPATDIRVNGEFIYDDTHTKLLEPREIKLNFNSDSEPGETAFRLGERYGSIRARSASVSGDMNYYLHEQSDWALEDMNISYALSSPEFIPSDQLQQEYGRMFQNFGINTSRLPARRWDGQIERSDQGINLTETEIETAFFDAGINIAIHADDDGTPRVDDGRIRIYNQSTSFRQFLNDLETLTGMDLKREEDELIMRLRGPVQDLSFQFGDE